MIVIINGPLGAGKTEISWELLPHFDRAVMLDGDYIGAVHPFEIYDSSRVDYLYRSIHHLVGFHHANGYRDFVVNYVFETPESLAKLRRMLSDYDDVTYAFRLVCAAAELKRRVCARARNQMFDPERLTWELERCHELAAIQDRAAQRGDMGFPLDVTHLDARQAARAIWEDIHEEVKLTPYDPAWEVAFQVERALIAAALGPLAHEIHHIGSTAVPGLPAKPVIDIMVAVEQLDRAVDCIAPLRELDYAFIDYPQNTDRRFFRKGKPRSHHLHIVAGGSNPLADHLDFRNALRAQPELRQAYSDLKNSLAQAHKDDRATYSENKSAFVDAALHDYRSGLMKVS